MSKRAFFPADILLPRGTDMEKWSVIACDQFTSEPEYWTEVERLVGDAPSTLRLMLPEAYLDHPDTDRKIAEVNAEMDRYVESGVFRCLPDSFVYTERRLSVGGVRRGLVGKLDLETYDYKGDRSALVHSTEGTVEERLPPRVKVRQGACLEMPHIVIFIDDPARTVIEPVAASKCDADKLYDVELMCRGGHITGWHVHGEAAEQVQAALERLAEAEQLEAKYGTSETPMVFAVGDGNHSLATAKRCWDSMKTGLRPEEREGHPARFALVELVNLHDESIEFEPIHRVVFDIADPAHFAGAAAQFLAAKSRGGAAHTVRCIAGECDVTVSVAGLSIGELIGAAEEFCQSYIRDNGGRIDYIHGDDTAAGMGAADGSAALLLPAMEKAELFGSIIKSGVFPRKSFSIGHARDKRYYMECRKIRRA